ncbi:hypothetical protein [Nannocystis pusilla]|uniref:hypothetical protein n=1 Tax=Nannocystis pusilla TaxID=889268 RepID=UPI003B82170A
MDLLVQSEAGTYQMVALGYLDFVCWAPQVLATVVVSGDPDTSLQIPQVLTPPALYPRSTIRRGPVTRSRTRASSSSR